MSAEVTLARSGRVTFSFRADPDSRISVADSFNGWIPDEYMLG